MPNKIKFTNQSLNGTLSKGNAKINVGGITGPTRESGFYNGINPPVNGYTFYIDKNGPIVEDGMILYLDAGNYTSYNPNTSGNTWYDISGNNYNAYGDPGGSGGGYDDAQFPIWQPDDGGRFFFDTSKGLTILDDMGSYNELTADFWIYKVGVSIAYLFDARNDGGEWWITDYQNSNINIYSNLEANDPPTYQSNSNWWERWINIVITSDSSQSALYINNEKIDDSRLINSDPINKTLGQYFRIGNRYNSYSRWNGYFSNIRFYDRVLTEQEISQNYNTLKNRFGL